MAELVNIIDVRAACYAEPENDAQLIPIKNSNEAYVLSATGYIVPDTGSIDARAVQAVLSLCYLDFWPDKDPQGNIRASVTRLIKQLQAEAVS